MKRYTGSCHCGKVEFAFESEEITRGTRCNCSMCKRLGVVHSLKLEPGSIKVLSGEDHLKIYLHGDKEVPFAFCSNCGIYVFYDGRQQGKVNLGCVDAVDTFKLDISVYDGKNLL